MLLDLRDDWRCAILADFGFTRALNALETLAFLLGRSIAHS